MSSATYDQWKLRCPDDETPPEEDERRDECGSCEGLDGSHDPSCEERPSFGDWVDHGIDRLKDLVPLLALFFLFTGCSSDARLLVDGGTEWQLPDGGWVSAGVGCGCNNVQEQLVEDDGAHEHVLLECVPNPELACDYRSGKYPDGSPCAAASVCFGASCCVWTLPQGGVR